MLAARHNIRVTRPECLALAGPGEISGKPVLLAKPQTFMNLSGTSVKPLMAKHEILPENLVLVYDYLDLPWGNIRVRPKGSPGSHNGVKSVIAEMGTDSFTRVRVGIHPDHLVEDTAGYDLAPFERGLKQGLDEMLTYAAEAIESIIADGAIKAMTKFNRRGKGPVGIFRHRDHGLGADLDRRHEILRHIDIDAQLRDVGNNEQGRTGA